MNFKEMKVILGTELKKNHTVIRDNINECFLGNEMFIKNGRPCIDFYIALP